MNRLRDEFKDSGVTTLYVYPNEGEKRGAVFQHQLEYGASQESAWLDVGDLVTLTGATTTPEAALLVREGDRWRAVYAGRIDDRYVHFGVERAHVEHHDAEDAVRAALADRPIPNPGGPPVGCGIMRNVGGDPAGAT